MTLAASRLPSHPALSPRLPHLPNLAQRQTNMTSSKTIVLEFGGGLEALFSDAKSLSVTPPADIQSLGKLITWVRDHLITARHDMFVSGDALRPGVLVLVNDVDWELEDTVNYRFAGGDRIAFISTLHGG
ncbi:unnamed protein product [Chondrus crispus]|uniref:Ubiquitin-related modifier 1 homolog n=1 Tax=Chondrus crispus TaxID=2769 RepID=R7Q6Y1_CHOCR|nr:unnamed protein product [Chondrus crispus]CDF34292.1 unnamed protein product [Chondrus crispus]|eukprot:XP_005714111.1 unnamed protein product [Chondrus crispus]